MALNIQFNGSDTILTSQQVVQPVALAPAVSVDEKWRSLDWDCSMRGTASAHPCCFQEHNLLGFGLLKIEGCGGEQVSFPHTAVPTKISPHSLCEHRFHGVGAKLRNGDQKSHRWHIEESPNAFGLCWMNLEFGFGNTIHYAIKTHWFPSVIRQACK